MKKSDDVRSDEIVIEAHAGSRVPELRVIENNDRSVVIMQDGHRIAVTGDNLLDLIPALIDIAARCDQWPNCACGVSSDEDDDAENEIVPTTRMVGRA